MTRTIFLTLGIFFWGVSLAAAGSQVGGHLINSTKGNVLTNVAIVNSKANQGSVSLNNSKVKGHVINSVKGKVLTNVAIVNSEANQASITLK